MVYVCNLKANLGVALHYLSYDKCVNLHKFYGIILNYLLIMTMVVNCDANLGVTFYFFNDICE